MQCKVKKQRKCSSGIQEDAEENKAGRLINRWMN